MDHTSPPCELPDRERTMLAYLAGTLSDVDADAFEAHCMGCEECAAEIERGVEIRAAGRAAAAALIPRRTVPWRWLAIAATVVLAVSVWKFMPGGSAVAPVPAPPVATPLPTVTDAPPRIVPIPSPTPKSPDAGVLRSPAGAGLRATATRRADASIELKWPAVDGAIGYSVTVSAVDGSDVLKRKSDVPSLAIEAAWFAARPAGERLFATVEALNALDAVVSSSARVELPMRRKGSDR